MYIAHLEYRTQEHEFIDSMAYKGIRCTIFEFKGTNKESLTIRYSVLAKKKGKKGGARADSNSTTWQAPEHAPF